MKKILFAVIYLTVFLSNCSGQKHDNIWLLGSIGSIPFPGQGITALDFSNDSVAIYLRPDIMMTWDESNVTFCNEDGEVLYYSNAIIVVDSSGSVMQNGQGLNPPGFGLNLPQGVLALPFPNQNHLSYLLTAEKGYINGWGPECIGLYYSIINMEENGGLGEVILKREPLIIDTLEYGKIVATKHANGRDWWIVINESHTNRFYKILLDNNGIAVYDNQTIGMPNEEGLGQATFSPDGNTYVMFNTIDEEVGTFVEIYDFDRCSGELSNHRRINYDEDAASGGVAISPNSRYLYVSSYRQIYQFDLWADSIASTRDTVAVYDGFQSPFGTRFFLAQLAPDGKIYINSPNSVNVLHVIHNPDAAGAACNVEQHGIQLLTENSFSMPNHPNYRLGALAGSVCDTLPPIAAFTEEADIANVLLYQFQDESLQGVNSWYWDFGDGTSSEKVYPLHLFPGLGSYEVCLTVSNGVEEDTYCKTISIELVSLEDLKKPEVLLYPNPTNKELMIELQQAGFDELKIQTALANVLLQQSLSGEPENLQLDLSHLSPGLYFCSFYKNGELVSCEKVMILH